MRIACHRGGGRARGRLLRRAQRAAAAAAHLPRRRAGACRGRRAARRPQGRRRGGGAGPRRGGNRGPLAGPAPRPPRRRALGGSPAGAGRVRADRGLPGFRPAALGAGQPRPLPCLAHAGRRGPPLRGGLHGGRAAGRAGVAGRDARPGLGPARARGLHGVRERKRGREPAGDGGGSAGTLPLRRAANEAAAKVFAALEAEPK